MTDRFPHTQYAEDQPNAHAILYLHVMRASAMSFTFISALRYPVSLIRNTRRQVPLSRHTIVANTIKSSGRALVIGSVAGAVMTWGRMRGKEEIEWQDRAWRIQENKGEVRTDWETFGLAGLSAVAAWGAVRKGAIPISAGNAILGGAGLGMATGVPYMMGTFAAGRPPA